MSSSSRTRFSNALPALATRLASFFAAFLETFFIDLAGLRACFFIISKVHPKQRDCQACPALKWYGTCRRREDGLIVRQVTVGRTLHDRALEEIRIDGSPQLDRVSEHEFAEILSSDHILLDHFVGLFEDLQHVGHIEMADVGPE